MKKFQFSLDKLLNFKQQMLQKEKNELARLRSEQEQCRDERQKMLRNAEQANRRFNEDFQNGMAMAEVTLRKGYINGCHQQAKVLENTIARYEQMIQNQLQVVVEATKEVSTIEKLKEKQWEEYKMASQKAEEAFIEEYVSHSQFYSS